MSTTFQNSVLQFGDPLGFKVNPGTLPSPALSQKGRDTFKVEARALRGHQKEAVVTQGEAGSVWRLACDEGKVMNGDDLAPFPLGFFNVGVMSDLYGRLQYLANTQNIALGATRIGMSQLYGSSGSFIHSTATAHVESSRLHIALNGKLDPAAAKKLVHMALDSSPAIALLRTPMTSNTFALYINGRRCKIITHKNSTAQNAIDPYLAYTSSPRPCEHTPREDLIRKADASENHDVELIPFTNTNKRLFAVDAQGSALSKSGAFQSETWIARPGMSRFSFISDERPSQTAPSGLGLMSAGIGFCYLTQLSRYIEAQRLDISDARLVQFNPYTAAPQAKADAIDTHLFLNGSAPEETHLNLLTIAAHTCFMHVVAATAIKPELEISVNGETLAA